MMRWLNKRSGSSQGDNQQRNPEASGLSAGLLIRNTSPYPTSRVESLLHFAFGDVLHIGVEVHVKGSNRSYRGRAYDGIPRMANVADSAHYLVTIGLFRTENGLPQRVNPGTKRLRHQYPDGFAVDGWEDVLVYVAAHEARHIWQFQARRKSQEVALSEVDADVYAICQLNRWRRSSGRKPFNSQC